MYDHRGGEFIFVIHFFVQAGWKQQPIVGNVHVINLCCGREEEILFSRFNMCKQSPLSECVWN